MIKIKPALWYCILTLELIFIGLLLFYFIIKTFSTDHEHWLFNIIQTPTCLFNLPTWCYLFLWTWDDNTVWHDCLLDLLQKNYCLQTQVKHLIIQSKFKALLASDVINLLLKTTLSRLGNRLHWLDTLVDWRSLPETGWINIV